MPRGGPPQVLTAPEHDCAFLLPGAGAAAGTGGARGPAASAGPLALSVDSLVEGVHFRRDWLAPEDAGWKALATALSDLAAARARPIGFLVALELPDADFAAPAWVDGLMAGVAEAAAAFGCPCLGGNTCGGVLALGVTTTVIGMPEPPAAPPLLRSGAAPGELLLLSGPCGLADRAVSALLRGETPSSIPPAALAAFRRPRPRLDLRASLAAASAAVDLSDGLLQDAAQLARASDVALVLDPDAGLARALDAELGRDAARKLAWTGGGDYELLATAKHPLPGWIVFGRVDPGPADLRFSDGTPLPPRLGHDHGAPRP
jgi:thiamine-monophosphate kinase